MSFYTALVIIMAIVSVTVLGLSAIGTYKELKYERRAAASGLLQELCRKLYHRDSCAGRSTDSAQERKEGGYQSEKESIYRGTGNEQYNL